VANESMLDVYKSWLSMKAEKRPKLIITGSATVNTRYLEFIFTHSFIVTYVTDRRQTKASLNASALWGGRIIMAVV